MSAIREVGEWEIRAGRLKQAGAYAASPSEIVAVHAGLYPDAAPICNTGCPGAILTAYQSILRWIRLHATAQPLLSTSSTTMKKPQVQARFKSDDTVYTPFGLGVAYSNANLTDKAARYILENDPDAEQYFAALPEDEEGDEDEDETEKPVRLSRANKETLLDYYRTELKQEPAEDATNEELRKAIADHRAATGNTQE